MELSADDLDVSYYEGLEVDLDPYLSEALFLELPSYPGCDEAVFEGCPSYQDFVRQQRHNAPEAKADDVDPRWDALRALKAKMADQGGERN